MTKYTDLSPYTYLPESVPAGVPARTVGWLDDDLDFPRGDVPEGFLDAFLSLARDHASARTRGWHACTLPHPEGALPYPYYVSPGTPEAFALGSAEVRVTSATGDLLIAPNLLYHYVRDHHYLPPAAFVEAVLAGRYATEAGA